MPEAISSVAPVILPSWGGDEPPFVPPATTGAPTGFADNFSAVHDSFLASEMKRSQATDIYDAYEDYRTQMKKLGEDYPSLNFVRVAETIAENMAGKPMAREKLSMQNDPMRLNLIELNDRMEADKVKYGTKSLRDIVENVNKAGREKSAREEEVRALSGGTSGWLGAQAGGMVAWLEGTLGFRRTDPLTGVASLVAQGVGRNPVVRILSEGTMQGSLEAVNQFTGVTAQKKRMGIETSTEDAWGNVALAAGAGAIFRGVFEGAPIIKAKAQELSGLSSKELLERFREEKPGSVKATATETVQPPSVRAADMALEREVLTESWNPAEVNVQSAAEGDVMNPDVLLAIQKDARHNAAMDAAEEALNGYPERFNSIPLPSEAEMRAYGERSATVTPENMREAQQIKTQLTQATSFDVNNPASLKEHLGYAPVSLSQFIKNAGGIAESGGELSARGITNKKLPGLIRKTTDKYGNNLKAATARQLDYVKQEVFDAGYFPEKSHYDDITADELLDAIATDVQGEKIYDGSTSDEIAALEREAGGGEQALSRAGISPDMTIEDIAQILAEHDHAAVREEMQRWIEGELAMRAAREPAALEQKVEALDALEAEEMQRLENNYAEVKKELEGVDEFTTQNAKGEVVTRILQDLLDDVELETALVQAMNVCGVRI